MNQKILCFHHSDLDGMGVKLVTKLFAKIMNLDVETFNCNYGDIDEAISNRLSQVTEEEPICMIMIGDISVQNKKVADMLDKWKDKSLVVLRDHHATATWLNKYDWAEVHEKDKEGVYRCGTYWTAAYLFPELIAHEDFRKEHSTLMEFIRYVDLYDTWKWMDDPQNPITEADDLNSVFKLMGEKMFTDYMFTRLFTNLPLFDETARTLITIRTSKLDSRASTLEKDMKVFNFNYILMSTNEEAALHEYYKENLPDKLNWAEKTLRVGYTHKFKVGVVFEYRDISDVGNRLLQNHPELDFIIFIALPKLISYRSSKNLVIPLGTMAKHITGYGGGHSQAAGGSLHQKITEEVTRRIIPMLGEKIND